MHDFNFLNLCSNAIWFTFKRNAILFILDWSFYINFLFIGKYTWIHHKTQLWGEMVGAVEMGHWFLKLMIWQLLQQELMILCRSWTRSATQFRKPWALFISFTLQFLPSMLPFKCLYSSACILFWSFSCNAFFFLCFVFVSCSKLIIFYFKHPSNGLVVELDNMVKLAEKCNIQVPMEVVKWVIYLCICSYSFLLT